MKTSNDFIIDAVITWVDGNDPVHKVKIENYITNKSSRNSKSLKMRFGQVNEIEFAVKSILKYAKFVRNIFIVTDNQTPEFLSDIEKARREYPTVFIVDHKIIFEGYHQYLPTFNSLSIESLLYKIPDLAEHFLYLNDDFFIASIAKIEDFFIEGKPVVRGFWTNFHKNIWHKKIKLKFQEITGSKRLLYSHNQGLQKTPEILGFKKYVRLEHTVAPLRKSTFVNYYMENPEMLDLNIKHRFRHPDQYSIQSLANHLEIKSKTYILKNDYQLVYFQNYKKPFFWIKFKLSRLTNKGNKLFLCMQSLDQCPEKKLAYIKNWLHNKYD